MDTEEYYFLNFKNIIFSIWDLICHLMAIPSPVEPAVYSDLWCFGAVLLINLFWNLFRAWRVVNSSFAALTCTERLSTGWIRARYVGTQKEKGFETSAAKPISVYTPACCSCHLNMHIIRQWPVGFAYAASQFSDMSCKVSHVRLSCLTAIKKDPKNAKLSLIGKHSYP